MEHQYAASPKRSCLPIARRLARHTSARRPTHGVHYRSQFRAFVAKAKGLVYKGLSAIESDEFMKYVSRVRARPISQWENRTAYFNPSSFIICHT